MHRHVKRGDSVLKFFLSCAVQGAHRAKRPNAVAAFYRKKGKQLGRPEALVAAARRMGGVVWAVLGRGEPYADEDFRRTARKAEDLRAKAQRSLPSMSVGGLQELVGELRSKTELLDRFSKTRDGWKPRRR
jgi:hypothetical protein